MEFTALFEFIERFGSEVEGRNMAHPDEKTAEGLERFAQGNASNEEREKFCRLLVENPVWIPWFTDRIRKYNGQEEEEGR